MAQFSTPITANSKLGATGELTRAATAGLESGASPQSIASQQVQVEQQRREMIRALSRRASLPALIADTNQFDLRQACRVAKIALEEDPDFDKKLIDLVKSGAASAPEQVIRILTVLESVCATPRLLAHILRLKHSEGRVRSKLTLIVGRLTRDPQWLRQQMEDEDPRVRANAIEGLWNVRAGGLEELLRSALQDPNHRVAANAALALHKIGNVSAVASLYSMLRHPDEMFRVAALWAVGQTRDPRFLDAVEKLAAGASSATKENLPHNVKEELCSARRSSEFMASLSLEVSQHKLLDSGERRVRLCCVADSVGGWLGHADINAVNFVIKEGKEQIEDYRLTWVNDPSPLSALIVQPLSWNGNGQLLRPALHGAGVKEIYGLLSYQTHNSPLRGKEHGDTTEVRFENYLEMSKEHPGHICGVATSLDTAISLGLSAMDKQEGKKHLFVLIDPSVGDAGALTEATSAGYGDTQVHAIVWEKATPELRESLRELASKSGGRFTLASSSREFTKTVMSVRAAQFGSFELAWQPHKVSKLNKVHIHCYSPFGDGSVSLASLR